MNQSTPSYTRGHWVASGLSQRVMHKLRTCKDCTGAYRYSHTHTHSRYCPGCLPTHPRRCTICKAPFHPRQDTDRHCPTCVVHPTLFGQENQP
jgi:hypothetical protein